MLYFLVKSVSRPKTPPLFDRIFDWAGFSTEISTENPTGILLPTEEHLEKVTGRKVVENPALAEVKGEDPEVNRVEGARLPARADRDPRTVSREVNPARSVHRDRHTVTLTNGDALSVPKRDVAVGLGGNGAHFTLFSLGCDLSLCPTGPIVNSLKPRAGVPYRTSEQLTLTLANGANPRTVEMLNEFGVGNTSEAPRAGLVLIVPANLGGASLACLAHDYNLV